MNLLTRISVATLTAACGFDLGPNPAVRMEIFSAAGHSVGIRESRRFDVVGYNASGLAGHVGSVRWTSGDTSIARVSSRGVVTGRKIGSTQINAVAGSLRASRRVWVRSATCSAATAPVSLTLGVPLVGALSGEDCFLPDDTQFPFADGWRLTLAAPSTVLFSNSSAVFEAQTLVTDLQMRAVMGDDIPFDLPIHGTRIVRNLAGGTYLVWAAGTLFDQTGEYRFHARTATPCGFANAAEALRLELTSIGELTSADCVLPDGRTADGRRLTVTAPIVLGLQATSAAFGPTTLLTTSGMQQIYPKGFVAPGALYALAPGSYLAWTIPLDDEAGGPYALFATSMLPCGPESFRGSISVGQTVADSLTLHDCLVSDYGAGDRWQLTLADLTKIEVDITWSTAHAELRVEVATQAGIPIEGSITNVNSHTTRRVLLLPGGTYTLTAFPAWGGGAYSLTVREVP